MNEFLEKIKNLKKRGARYITTVAYLNPENEQKIIVKHFFELEGKIEEVWTEGELKDCFGSIKDIYPAAIWAEREVMETYGIEFTGYSEEEKKLMMSSWQKGFPFVELEKDKILRKKQWK